MPADFISVNPDPLVEGQAGTVTYDFDGSGQTGTVTLRVTWTLADGTDVVDDVDVSPTSPSAKITPPAGAVTVNIRDLSSVSLDYGGAIAPPPSPIG